MKQLREVCMWRSCTRDSVEADESCLMKSFFFLGPSSPISIPPSHLLPVPNKPQGFLLFFRLKEELESTVSRVEIAKCTLQALIVGSGVNWAQDPDLLETVLLCGDSMQL